MSLIHWWPLNGDLQDKIQGKIFNNSGWTSASSGKIGTTYNANIGAVLSASLSMPNTFSFACWVKNNDLTYPQAPLPMKFSNGAPFSTASTSNKGWEFSHGNNSKLTLNNGSTAQELNFGTPHVSYLGSWYHLVFTVDCHLKKASLFINGELIGEKSFTITDFSGTYTFSLGQIHGWKLDGFVNDIRIYDHALSQAEVKELSKALVVHYTFDDILAEPTTNIYSGKSFEGHGSSWTALSEEYSGTPVYRNIVTSPNTGNNAGFRYTTTFSYTQSQATAPYITISFWKRLNVVYGRNLGGYIRVRYTDGVVSTHSWSYNKSNWANDSNSIGQWEYITGKASLSSGRTIEAITHLYVYTDQAAQGNCDFAGIMVEAKDHATPYTPTSRESMLVNEAGYGGNGTLYNSSLSTDTASGTWSCHTPRINPANTDGNVTTTNSAFVYADVFGYNHTPTEFTVAWWWKVMDWGYGTGPFGLVTSNGNYMDSTLGVHDGGVFVNFTGGNTRVFKGFTGGGTGNWTHFAITFKPGSYTSYINGVSQGTSTTDASLTLDPWRYLYLGAGCAGGLLRDGDIYWGDFRYYNTCLSANDIVELYKTKAYITDKGDIESGKFIEDKAEAMVTEKSTFECTEVYEEIDSAYERLEYIESTSGYTQCIDTGYYWKSESGRIDIDMEIRTLGTYQTLFGNEEYINSGSTRNFTHILHSSNSTGSFTIYNGSISSPGGISLPIQQRFFLEFYTTNNKKVYIKKDGIFLINGNSYYDSIQTKKNAYTNSSISTNVGHIFLFSNHNSGKGSTNAGTQHVTSMRVYSCKMYDNDVIVRNFIPVKRKSDNVLGLFDSVNKVFYTNAGSGTFGAGPSVTNKDASIYEDGHISGREIIEI